MSFYTQTGIDPREAFDEFKTDITFRLDQLRKENQNQKMTIKRYRQILNETLQSTEFKRVSTVKEDVNDSITMDKQSNEHAAKDRDGKRELSSNAGDLVKESALDDYISVISPNKQPNSKQSKQHLQTKFDFHRMSLLYKLVHDIIEAKHVSESFIAILKQVQEVINCSSCCFFVFGSRVFSDHDKKKLTIQKTAVEGKYIDVASLNDEQIQNPAFTVINEARNPIYTKQNMSQPLFDREGNLLGTI